MLKEKAYALSWLKNVNNNMQQNAFRLFPLLTIFQCEVDLHNRCYLKRTLEYAPGDSV